jgi:hypothetical protein
MSSLQSVMHDYRDIGQYSRELWFLPAEEIAELGAAIIRITFVG